MIKSVNGITILSPGFVKSVTAWMLAGFDFGTITKSPPVGLGVVEGVAIFPYHGSAADHLRERSIDLLPQELRVDDVWFKFGSTVAGDKNVLVPNGESLALPIAGRAQPLRRPARL